MFTIGTVLYRMGIFVTNFADILYHDLGKAVVLMQLWTDETTPDSIRWDAIKDDVLRTRRDSQMVLNVGQVWAQLQKTAGWSEFSETDFCGQLIQLMGVLVSHFDALEGSCNRKVLMDVERTCRAIHGITKEVRDGVER